MNIAIVVLHLDISGGTQRQALELATSLMKSGNKVTVYTLDFDRNNCYPEITKNIVIKSLEGKYEKVYWKSRIFKKLFGPIINNANLTKNIKNLLDMIDNDSDIINCHDNLINRLAFYAKRRVNRARFFWTLNDIPGVFLEKERKTWGIDEYRTQKVSLSLKAFVVLVHSYLVNKYFARNEKKYVKCFDKIMVLDNRNKKLVEKYFNRSANVVRSGLDAKAFNFNPKYSKDKEFTILGASILFPYRRFEDTIEAVKILKDKGYKIKFNLIGDDLYSRDYLIKLKKLVNSLGIKDNVKFLGKVSDETLVNYYHNSDVFVFVNHYQTWGLVVFEAMASGTPVIVSTSVGASEILIDNVNALIVPPMRPDKIAEKVEMLISDKELKKRIINNAKKFVDKNISWDIYGDNVLKLFKGKQ